MANPPHAAPPDPTPEPADADRDAPVYDSRPPTPGERVLIDRFYEQWADQSKLMDELGRQMITVELAVPGLYASILALLRGQEATLPGGWALAVAFGGWFVALALTFAAVFPRRYRVDPLLLRADPAAGEPLGLEEFFHRPARAKYTLLAAAAVAFAVGVAGAVVLLFG